MYYPDPSTFWDIFGARTTTFKWVDDSGGKPAPVTTGAITVRSPPPTRPGRTIPILEVEGPSSPMSLETARQMPL
jgi:hypothetical protein